MNIDARGLKFSHNVVLIGIYGWEEFGDSVSGGFLVSAACRGCSLVIIIIISLLLTTVVALFTQNYNG